MRRAKVDMLSTQGFFGFLLVLDVAPDIFLLHLQGLGLHHDAACAEAMQGLVGVFSKETSWTFPIWNTS